MLRGGRQFFLFLVIIWVENIQRANSQHLPICSAAPVPLPGVSTALQGSPAAGRAQVRIPKEAGPYIVPLFS